MIPVRRRRVAFWVTMMSGPVALAVVHDDAPDSKPGFWTRLTPLEDP